MVKPEDGDFAVEYDSRPDGEVVNAFVDQAVAHIRNTFGQDEDLIEILESLIISFTRMKNDASSGAAYMPRPELLPDMLVEVQLRIAAEQARRKGQVH